MDKLQWAEFVRHVADCIVLFDPDFSLWAAALVRPAAACNWWRTTAGTWSARRPAFCAC
jgi:hypothetical protein